MKTREILIAILATVLIVIFTAVPVIAEFEETDAESILKAMSDYVGSRKTIKLSFDSSIEVITPQLEKIQFTSSGDMLLSRPGRMRAHRRGGYADVELIFDGRTVSIVDKYNNGFVQFEAPGSLDQLFAILRAGHGIALPGADLLLANSYNILMAEVMEAKYIGHGVINGVDCEHLAFRNHDTDWQLWVESGRNPIPRKLVITSKTVNNAPQYTINIRHWETAVDAPQEAFVFMAPAGARQLDHNALIHLDELPPGESTGGSQ